MNGAIKNTLVPKFYYTSSPRYAIDYKVSNKRGKLFYFHFFKKVEEHSFKLINHLKHTTRLTEDEKQIVRLVYKLAHHPLGSSQMSVSMEVRKRNHSLAFFSELLREVL